MNIIISILLGFLAGDIFGRYKEWEENKDKKHNDNVHD